MEQYYILRLGKELYQQVTKLRNQLFSDWGHTGFQSLEPCIFLGPKGTDEPVGYVTRPPLPLQTNTSAVFKDNILFLPIEGNPFEQIRRELRTTFPVDGIYLGSDNIQLEKEPIIIKDVRFAVLSVETNGNLTTWSISSEKRLDSGRGR